jgi:hypothetical protein
VNPPFGDIVAPQLARDWGIAVESEAGFSYADDVKGGVEWTLEDGDRLEGTAWLLFGLADNVDENEANVTVVHEFLGERTVIDSDATFWTEHGDDIRTWRTANNKSAPILLPHADLDQPFAINLGGQLGVGTHTITVEITEQGDPWENKRTYVWSFFIHPPEASSE